MSDMKDIKNRIGSVKDTQKIINAMYLISSTKLRKARKELDSTNPYFNAISREIRRILSTTEGDIEHRYFYPSKFPKGKTDIDGPYGYIVVTADRGLAGDYNLNIIKEARQLMGKDGNVFYTVGEYGRHYMEVHGQEVRKSFIYPTHAPSLSYARKICDEVMEDYDQGIIKKISIIYTDYKSSVETKPRLMRILPFRRSDFNNVKTKSGNKPDYELMPSISEVLESIIPSYVLGTIYGALVDSFYCEQNARMNAMNNANNNAQELIADLTKQYNYTRQNIITQEVTEVAAGARAHKKKREQALKKGES